MLTQVGHRTRVRHGADDAVTPAKPKPTAVNTSPALPALNNQSCEGLGRTKQRKHGGGPHKFRKRGGKKLPCLHVFTRPDRNFHPQIKTTMLLYVQDCQSLLRLCKITDPRSECCPADKLPHRRAGREDDDEQPPNPKTNHSQIFCNARLNF
jgi:hypothetical protein